MKKNLLLITSIAVVALVGFIAFNSFNNDETMIEKDNMSHAEKGSKDDMMDSDGMNKDMDDNMGNDKDMADDMMMNDGEMAPTFKLSDLSGNEVALEDFKGKKVYIKFWASWCPICLNGLPEIDEIAGSDNDYEVISIVSPGSNGEKNSEDFKKWFATQNAKNLTVLLDEGGTITKTYGIRGYPTSAFIGTDGVLVAKFPGHVSKDVIEKQFMGIK